MAVKLTTRKQDAGRRLDQVLHEQLPQFSRSQLQQWIRDGRVRVNGAPQRPSYAMRQGDMTDVEPAERVPLRATPEPIPITVLYEDADVVAVDKPAGLVVHAGAGIRTGTLVNALVHRFALLSRVGGHLRPGIVHRLDRFTSGVLLVAKNDTAHRHLADQFSKRLVEKVYLALVHGEVKPGKGRIDRPISRDPNRRTRMTARLGRGREAWTEYKVLRHVGQFSYLELRIGTGRTHQIRAHLSAIGHPVAGDRLYGAPAKVEGRPALGRYFLHAHRIRFQQPSTGAEVQVESPLPDELLSWMGDYN